MNSPRKNRSPGRARRPGEGPNDWQPQVPRSVTRAELQTRAHNDKSIYGLHAINAVLANQPDRVIELLVEDRRAAGSLLPWLAERKAAGDRYRLVSRSLLDDLAQGGRHQGVAALVRPFRYSALDQTCQRPDSAVVVLDGVEDPRNLGATARAALALGATGLVIPRNRAAQVTASAEHVAAGALSQLAVAQVTNLTRALQDLKNLGLWIVGAEADAKIHPWEVDMTSPIALVVGGEDSGLRRLVRQRCDFVVSIPMSPGGHSLNAADAACVLLYEMTRQRRLAPINS